MKKNIKFSILVPVYQVEKYIDECIQSVLSQTYQNWELILVDDGSRDRSGEICDRYAERYPNIYVYHKENRGQIHTRGYAIARMTGDYCVFLDSDDLLKQNALEVIYHTIQKYNCDCVIYGMERFLNEKIIEVSDDEEECYITDKRELYRKCFLGYYNPLWRKAVKTAIFKGGERDYSPYFHIAVGEDLLQSIEIIEGSSSVAFINDRLYRYRANPESIMGTLTIKGHRSYLTVCQKVYEFLQQQDEISEEDLAEFRGFYLKAIGSYIITVSTSKEKYAEKIRLFRETRDLELYRCIMPTGTYDKSKAAFKTRVFMELFLKERYRTLILLSTVYESLRNRQKTSKAEAERKNGSK